MGGMDGGGVVVGGGCWGVSRGSNKNRWGGGDRLEYGLEEKKRR